MILVLLNESVLPLARYISQLFPTIIFKMYSRKYILASLLAIALTEGAAFESDILSESLVEAPISSHAAASAEHSEEVQGVELSEDCIICMEAMTQATAMAFPGPCAFNKPDVSAADTHHMFHKDCLQRWISRHPNCPVCRAPTAPGIVPPVDPLQRAVRERVERDVEVQPDRFDFDLRWPADDDDLALFVANNPQAQSLVIRGTRMTDAGVAHLAGLPNLHELILEAPGVTGSGLSHLAQLEHLWRLRIVGNQVTDQSLAQIATLTRLSHLVVMSENLTAAGGLQHLAELPALEFLGIDRVLLPDLSAFERFPRLTRLKIGLGCRLASRTIQEFRNARPDIEVEN
jgi:hypothetical protein